MLVHCLNLYPKYISSTTNSVYFILVRFFKRESPDVCILMGPILDIKNPEVENCQLAEPFEERFQIIVDQIRSFTAE